MARGRKLKPGQYDSIPPFIRVEDNRWCLAGRADVTAWRKAQQVGRTDDLKHTLLQFRAATQILELAQEYGLPEDAVVLPTLDLFNGEENPEAALGIVKGADGVWRNKCDLAASTPLKPKLDLQLVE